MHRCPRCSVEIEIEIEIEIELEKELEKREKNKKMKATQAATAAQHCGPVRLCSPAHVIRVAQHRSHVRHR